MTAWRGIVLLFLLLFVLRISEAPAFAQPSRARVGVALGGGSARGIAHVGVMRWLEEHRIPVDVMAGTSMGGLIGGLFAMGLSAGEVEQVLDGIDWDTMFGGSDFAYRNVRRKRDGRAYPFPIEFGLKQGFQAQPSINSGQSVDLLLARVTAPYFALAHFDDLPTPFRVVSVDLVTARAVTLERGSLATAMRATMSLPGIFPPIELDGRVLVDGGVLNNIPTDVVRGMGATRVIAVNVGDLSDLEKVKYSLLGLIGESLDAMMRANSVRSMAASDIAINVPLKEYGSLDWRRHRELIAEGHKAAEAMRDQLLPLALDEAAWQAWTAARTSSRRSALPVLSGLHVAGAATADTAVMERTLAPHVGSGLRIDAIEADLTALGGLDRYETLSWRLIPSAGGADLHVDALPKKHGPPFLFLGASLENTTGSEFRFGMAGRYLAYDWFGSGSELRIDAAIGSDPSLAAAWYRPLWQSPFFIEPIAGISSETLRFTEDDQTVATYRQVRSAAGIDLGVNLGRLDDVRLGLRAMRLDASVRVGDPGLPELGGREVVGDVRWTHDGQDSPVVPSRGVHSQGTVRYFFDAPEVPSGETDRTSLRVTQMEGRLTSMHTVGTRRRGRVFLIGGAGSSFDGEPLPPEQFALGGPFRLGASAVGELRGDHYMLASGGYLHRIGRLPDFLGGPIFAGGWLETGKAFNVWSDTSYAVQGSGGLIMDTLIGPVLLASSTGKSGEWRWYFGIGRIFR